MTIREIQAEDTWSIRHQVMWPHKPFDYVKLAEDEHGRHFGAYHGDRLVSVVSLFIDGDVAQFRKFATQADMQGKGYGTALLRHLVTEASASGVRKLWCNARTPKAAFYERAGFKKTDMTFDKDGVEYVVMERQTNNTMKKGFDFFTTRLNGDPYDLSSIVQLPDLYKLFVTYFEVNARCLRVDKFRTRDGDVVSIGSIKIQLPDGSSSVYLNNFLDHSDILEQWNVSKHEIEWSTHKLIRIALLGQAGFGGLYLGCGEHNSDEIWIFNADSKRQFKKVDANIFDFVRRLEFSTDFSNLENEENENLYKNWQEEFWRVRE